MFSQKDWSAMSGKNQKKVLLYYLMLENEAFKFKLNQIKILRGYNGREASHFQEMKQELLPRFVEFKPFDYHYIKRRTSCFLISKKFGTVIVH